MNLLGQQIRGVANALVPCSTSADPLWFQRWGEWTAPRQADRIPPQGQPSISLDFLLSGLSMKIHHRAAHKCGGDTLSKVLFNYWRMGARGRCLFPILQRTCEALSKRFVSGFPLLSSLVTSIHWLFLLPCFILPFLHLPNKLLGLNKAVE